MGRLFLHSVPRGFETSDQGRQILIRNDPPKNRESTRALEDRRIKNWQEFPGALKIRVKKYLNSLAHTHYDRSVREIP